MVLYTKTGLGLRSYMRRVLQYASSSSRIATTALPSGLRSRYLTLKGVTISFRIPPVFRSHTMMVVGDMLGSLLSDIVPLMLSPIVVVVVIKKENENRQLTGY